MRTLKALITERNTKKAKKAVRKTASDGLPFLWKNWIKGMSKRTLRGGGERGD